MTRGEELLRQLDHIREAGYTISNGEVDLGVGGVAAPVFSVGQRVVAGLSAAGLEFRVTDAVFPRIISAVTSAAQEISGRLSDIAG